MSNEYDNDRETGLVAYSDEPEEGRQIVQKEKSSEEYYDLPPAIRSRTLLWSVISIICGALSILLCPYYYVGYAFAVAAVVFSLVSRKNLGFFEKYSIMGIIFGIMGFVFGTFSLIIDLLGLFG